jgi:hypothetical protein
MGKMTNAMKSILELTAAARLEAKRKEIADLEQRIAQLDAAKVERTKALEAEWNTAPDESTFEAKAAEFAAHLAAPVTGLAWAQKQLAAAAAALPALERAAKEERFELLAAEAPKHRQALLDSMTRAIAAEAAAKVAVRDAWFAVDDAEFADEQAIAELRAHAAELGRKVPEVAMFTADVVRRAAQSIEAYTAAIAQFNERENQLPQGEGPFAQQARMRLNGERSDFTAQHHRGLMQLYFGQLTHDYAAAVLGYSASEQLADLHVDPLRYLARRSKVLGEDAVRRAEQKRTNARAERAKLESQMREREIALGMPAIELPDDDDVHEHAGA